MKNVLSIHRQGEGHWVGDGFPVHTVFHYQERPELSPFLLLDHAGPADFAPSDKPRGVGWHPHRGFETVTVVLDGEVDHEDTAGNGGRIASGDVQWMTAGAGLLHKEMHSPEFTRRSGRFQALQLWVNLPRSEEHTSELQSRSDLVCRLLLEKKTQTWSSSGRWRRMTKILHPPSSNRRRGHGQLPLASRCAASPTTHERTHVLATLPSARR